MTTIAKKPASKAGKKTTSKQTKQAEGPGYGEAIGGVAKKASAKKKQAPSKVQHHGSSLGGQNQNYRGSGMGLGRSQGIATRRRQGTK